MLPCRFRTDFARKAASPSELGDVNATRKEKPVKELPSVAKAGEVWMGLVALQSFLGSGLPMSPCLPAVRTTLRLPALDLLLTFLPAIIGQLCQYIP